MNVGITRKPYFKSVFISLCLFIALSLLVTLTSPLENIAFTAVFFVLLLILLISSGYSLLYIRRGVAPSAKSRFRIVILAVFIVIALMFRSARSLNLIDILILILVSLGLLFYSSKRLSR